jgi:hypothetical protein
MRYGSIAAGCVAAIAALALTGATQANAGSHRTHKPARSAYAAPVKDCTRFNGRWGYYGNPWCTREEQARFDRWDNSRIR